MRYIFILIALMLIKCTAAGSDFTLLDVSGGIWNVQQVLGRILEHGSSFPDGSELTFESVEKLPEILAVDQAAVIAGKPGPRLKQGYRYAALEPAAVVLLVGIDCPVDGLSVSDVRRIYSGRAAVWSRFSSSNLPIRRAGFGRDTVWGKVFFYTVMADRSGSTATADPARMIAPGMVLCSSRAAVLALLQAVPGIIVFADERLAKAPQGKFKVLKIDNMSHMDEKYPLAVPLGILYRQEVPPERIKKIIDLVQRHPSGKHGSDAPGSDQNKKINNKIVK